MRRVCSRHDEGGISFVGARPLKVDRQRTAARPIKSGAMLHRGVEIHIPSRKKQLPHLRRSQPKTTTLARNAPLPLVAISRSV